MKLLYKQHILNEMEHARFGGSFFAQFWNRELLAYVDSLGQNTKYLDEALFFLVNLNDDLYSGCSEEVKRFENGKYYLYEPSDKILYWFANPGDAIYFANDYNGATMDLSLISKPQDGYSYSNDFEAYNRKLHNGFYWLNADDLDSIDDILSAPPIILCVEKQKMFDSEASAVAWLVESGKAANAKTAARQLSKCLNGETNRCYGFTWRRQ